MFYGSKNLITQSLAFYRHPIKGLCKVLLTHPWAASILFATGVGGKAINTLYQIKRTNPR